MSSPAYSSIRGEAISLRNWLRIVLWTEFAGVLFCGSVLFYCFWNSDAEMVFFRMHFVGATLKLIIAMLTIRFILDYRKHLIMLHSQPLQNN